MTDSYIGPKRLIVQAPLEQSLYELVRRTSCSQRLTVAAFVRQCLRSHLLGNDLLALKPAAEEPYSKAAKTLSRSFKFRASARTLEQARKRALHDGATLSRWVRCVIEKELCSSPPLTSRDLSALNDASNSVSRLGVNINQIARKLNQVDQLGEAQLTAELSRSLPHLRSLIDTVESTLASQLSAFQQLMEQAPSLR